MCGPVDRADHLRLDAEVAERLEQPGRDALLAGGVGPHLLGARARQQRSASAAASGSRDRRSRRRGSGPAASAAPDRALRRRRRRRRGRDVGLGSRRLLRSARVVELGRPRSAAPRRGSRARSARGPRARAASARSGARRCFACAPPPGGACDRARERARRRARISAASEPPESRTTPASARKTARMCAPVVPIRREAAHSSAWPTTPPWARKYADDQKPCAGPLPASASALAAANSSSAPARNGRSVGQHRAHPRAARPPPASATGTPSSRLADQPRERPARASRRRGRRPSAP